MPSVARRSHLLSRFSQTGRLAGFPGTARPAFRICSLIHFSQDPPGELEGSPIALGTALHWSKPHSKFEIFTKTVTCGFWSVGALHQTSTQATKNGDSASKFRGDERSEKDLKC